MEITERNIQKWSTIGARPTFGQALLALGEIDDKLVVLTADVSTSAGLDRFKKRYPEKYIDVGIAEQNMMGIATGLATNGFHVVTATFAPFQSMRCLEQIRVYQGYMKMPLVMVGLASGVYHSYLGNTHCSLEDAAILRAIPNVAVVTPADCTEIIKSVEAAIRYDKAVYIRLIEGAGIPPIYHEDYDFKIGKAKILKEGSDIMILANGRMVYTALDIAANLEQSGFSPEVVDFHTIKPFDKECLDRSASFKYLVTIEEHNVIGGLGSAVAEYLMQKKCKPQMLICGIEDFYPHAGDYASALEQTGLTSDKLTERILRKMEELN
ncbi:MAG: transketolase family protein [Fretibacterium sp.]|nr:transketolase family protein [Fretibacterium sp.]